jgi:hypothetical protein
MAVFVAVLAAPWEALAQANGGSQGERTLVELERRKVELRTAEAERERALNMFAAGLISKGELDRYDANVELARLNFREALVDLLALHPRISVREAVKFRSSDGKKRVRLTLQNVSREIEGRELDAMMDATTRAAVEQTLGDRTIRDVFVSLRGPSGAAESGAGRETIIALPYEQHLPALSVGRPQTLEFELLRDVSSLAVLLDYKGSQHVIEVELQQELPGGGVSLSSTQASQEAELGSSATFRLLLERASVEEHTYWLKAVNLPAGFEWLFQDPRTQARLTRVQMPAGVSRQELELKVFLPATPGADVATDTPLLFWALAGDETADSQIGNGGSVSQAVLERSRAAVLRLELTPRGTGRIEVEASTLLVELSAGEAVQVPLTITNTGSRRLDNLRIKVDAPTAWQVLPAPPHVPAVDVGQKVAVSVHVQAPEDAAVGDYEIRLRPESFAYGRQVLTEDKVLRVEVRRRGMGIGGIAALLALAGLLGALVVAAIRTSQR